MACIIKSLPKGVVSFTTPERDQIISKDSALQNKIKALKPNWTIGLHHNWHDYNFIRNHLFDFSMAGPDDLRGQPTPLVKLDACNFVPECFNISTDEKYWDILYVARTAAFKRIPIFFNFAKTLLAKKPDCKILLIAPVDPNSAKGFFNSYETRFSRSEKDRFAIIAPEHDYPFPYSTEMLAFFYKHSKIFVHMADEERRCRTSAYAWACGMPVVSQIHPASILPNHLRREPYYYRVTQENEYIPQAIKALSDYFKHDRDDFNKVIHFFSVEYTQRHLKASLDTLFKLGSSGAGLKEENYNMSNLDIRLGRHHGLATGSNKIPMTLTQFVDTLSDTDRVAKAMTTSDPEMALCK